MSTQSTTLLGYDIPPREEWVKGRGKKPSRVMFVTPCVLEEEAATETNVGYGRTIKRVPRMLDCPHGVLLKKLALREGLDIEQCYVTSIVKFLPPNKAHRSKPPKLLINAMMPALEEEFARVKPEIVICVGKLVWDCLSPHKVAEADAWGVWDWNPRYKFRIYMLPHLTQVMKPEKHEQFSLHLRAVANMYASLYSGESVANDECNITVVRNATDLRAFTEFLRDGNHKLLSVDCEWHGNQVVDGKLRSLQIAWDGSHGAYIRFMDDQLNYAFDVSYKEAGSILGEWLNRKDVKYIGHHVAVDISWMHHWLGLDWYNKAVFDTEFALQTCDEAAQLGLDILALRYTGFGKYDWDLIQWKKQHKALCEDGYGYIPDEILIPYGVKDVCTPYLAMPVIAKELERQQLTRYYKEILNPLVTDVNAFFTLKGIPIDRKKLTDMRDVYNWAYKEMKKDFLSLMAKEAGELLEKAIAEECPDLDAKATRTSIEEVLLRDGSTTAEKHAQALVGPAAWLKLKPVYDHFVLAPNFNMNSQPQRQAWLFTVKKYKPVKSTANKSAGMPSIDWEKIEAYPPEKQATFTPATDRGTLEIFAHRYNDKTIDALLSLNAVGKLCTAFLKESELVDGATGEAIKEKGLLAWLASDDTIRLNHSTTETGKILPSRGEIHAMQRFNCWNGSKRIPISSQATYVEGSTTIPAGSTPKWVEMGASQTGHAVGEDIVCSAGNK